MSRWKFHVVLPDGQEYLTETLEEARALEAKYGRSKHLHRRVEDHAPHGRPDRSKLVRNASQAPPSRKERMKPAMSDGYKHPPQAWAREAIQNSFDAGAKRIEFICGENDCLAIDDGTGMSEETLLNKLMVPGMSEKPSWAVGGFGEAKKLLTFPWDHFIIATKTLGGKTLVIIGSGEVWDYWRDGKCHLVKYARQRGPVPPHFTEITASRPEADFLPYADAKGIMAKLDKQGHGTAIYIRGTDELHDYMQESGFTRTLGGNKGLPSAADIISYVVKCELPGKKVIVDGKEFLPNVAIPPTAQRIPDRAAYDGIHLYLAPPSTTDSSGATLIRAKTSRGTQLMWTEAGIVPGTLFVEIVGDTKRLLTNTRDSFQWSPGEWWEKFKVQLAKDVSSTFRDDAFDEEFVGTGEAERAELDLKAEEAISKAMDIQYEYKQRARMRPADSKVEKRKQEQDEADRIAREIQKVARAAPTQQEIEEPEPTPQRAIQTTPSDLVDEMVEEAVKSESSAAIAGVVRLALWRPPLRITNQLRDWKPGPEWYPDTMGEAQIRLLRAWTEAVRRIHAILAQYDVGFSVGFIFSERTLAYTGWGKETPGRSYVINPYVSARELRAEELMIPSGMVSLRPDSPDVIALDATISRHLAIIAARAVHECVHGIYGISHHDEHFSSGLTCMIAQIGDKMPSILAAAKKGASAPVPRYVKAKGVERTTLRAAPQKVEKVGGVDPRIPPDGTVLRQKGLDAVVLFQTPDPPVFVVTRSSKNAVVGSVFPSLSAVVRAHEGYGSYNGFQYFDLLRYPADPGKAIAGVIPSHRREWLRSDMKSKTVGDTDDYLR
jgi:hypothetical protein